MWGTEEESDRERERDGGREGESDRGRERETGGGREREKALRASEWKVGCSES